MRQPAHIREKEEQDFMLKCFLEDEPDTDEGRATAYLDFQFIQGCLQVQKLRNFNKIGSRKTGYMAMLETYENLLTQRVMQDYEYGLVKKKEVLLSTVERLSYRFTFRYFKLKGKEGKKRKFKDKKEILAPDLDTAQIALKAQLKKLKEELVEITETHKEISMIHTSDGEIYDQYEIEIINDIQ